ncbi:hypothetical protein [Streptomyces sp. NPDC020996]|uniref:hypothetical protein n=1 Tax=Streptomyces sp. NPDC020996 TaxID=3154791 RepID=UPI0033DD5D37
MNPPRNSRASKRRSEELTRQLGELDAEIENLRITRNILLTLAMPHPPSGSTAPTSRPPACRQILTALDGAGRPLRALGLCRPRDLPILPKNTEGIRSPN